MGPNNEQNDEMCDARPNGFHPGGEQGMLPQISGTSSEKPKLAKKIFLWKKKFLNTD
jgi:hypothetical protein